MSLFTPVNMKTDLEIAQDKLSIDILKSKVRHLDGPPPTNGELLWAGECRQMREAVRVARGEPHSQSMEALAAQKNTIWLTYK